MSNRKNTSVRVLSGRAIKPVNRGGKSMNMARVTVVNKSCLSSSKQSIFLRLKDAIGSLFVKEKDMSWVYEMDYSDSLTAEQVEKYSKRR